MGLMCLFGHQWMEDRDMLICSDCGKVRNRKIRLNPKIAQIAQTKKPVIEDFDILMKKVIEIELLVERHDLMISQLLVKLKGGVKNEEHDNKRFQEVQADSKRD